MVRNIKYHVGHDDRYRWEKKLSQDHYHKAENELGNNISFWWVNQGQTHMQEKEGGYLWAPQVSKRGTPLAHHVRLLEAKVGDIVFCYSSLEIKSIAVVSKTAVEARKPSEIASHDWEDLGYKLDVTYYDLESSIRKDELPLQWRLDEKGPFDKNGDLIQGYFFELSIDFTRKLFQRFSERFPSEIRTKLIEYKQDSELSDTVAEHQFSNSNLSTTKLVEHIHNYITSKGFYYTKEEITNFYLSLRSKPFVILSGISGTGKTKMVQWFAESVGATDKNGRFTLIPIRPDWNDGSDLLGYVDIKGDFKAGPLTKVINNATENPEEPYFVLLDEMNLARVEHYFSDILSVMESRKWEDGKVVSSNLLTKETARSDLQLPNNLYIIGTVNMDETTYPFSKKVLDRANTIEFNRVDLDHFAFLEEVDLVEPEPLPVGNEWFQSEFLHLTDAYHHHKELIARVTDELVRINHVLERSNAHVGYRVRDEICFYMIYSAKDDLMHFDTALDHCILQKILPRISGSDSSVEQLLRGLFEIFTNMTFDEDLIDDDDFAFDSVKYPKSTKKVIEMYRRLSDGYTSFWIS